MTVTMGTITMTMTIDYELAYYRLSVSLLQVYEIVVVQASQYQFVNASLPGNKWYHRVK